MTDDRYHRLKTMQDYGLDIDWSELKNKTVLIVGVGGIGSISAEIMARVGIGRLIVIDFDKVEVANLNRLVYRDRNIGQYKVEALKETLIEVNNNVEVITYSQDIMDMMFEDEFEEIVQGSDLGLMCLDNIPARQFFNVKCVKLGIPYIDSGLFRSGLGGYIHLVIPKKSACYQCTGFVEVGKTNDARGKECSASMPTTVSIISSLQTQHALKYLLKFGVIPDYVSYNALTDQISQLILQMDENCYVCGDD